VKVLDFGLAKAMEPASAMSVNAMTSPTLSMHATQAGIILGTAAYMSPEQAKGRPADKRSDIWAFGCVLYEMLTGKRPFDGEDVTDTLAAVLRGEPDWSALPSDLPTSVHALIERCLVKDRRQRVGDVAVVQFVLAYPTAVALRGAPAVAATTPPRARWKSLAPMLAASLLTATVVVAGAWALRPSRAAAPVARFRLTLPEGPQLTTTVRSVLAISPEGTELAYVAGNRLFVRSLSEFDAHELAGAAAASAMLSPSFSPDGRSIAFFADGAVKRMPVTGGTAVTVCSIDPPFGLTWHATGILVGQAGNGIVRCPANGGARETLANVAAGEQAYGPVMLPGGRTLLFTIAKVTDGAARWDKAQIVAQTLASGARKTVVSGGSDARYALSGPLLYAVGGIVFAAPFDAASQTVGSPVPVIEGVRRANGANSGVTHFATSDNGTLVYIPGLTSTATLAFTIALADRTGTLTRLPIAPAPFNHVRASRDGSRLAIGSDDGKQAIVWIHELGATSALRRLTLVGENRFPIWSPDGERVAFQSDREGDLGIFTQRADGTGAVVRLTKPAQEERHVPESWSADGRVMTFSSVKNRVFSLQTLTIQDGKIAPFDNVKSAEPIGSVFSPDGRWLAYYSAPSETVAAGLASGLLNGGVFVQPFPATGEVHQVPKQQIDFQPLWSPKGNELFYVPTAASGQLATVSVTTKTAVTFGSPVLLPARVTGNRLSGETRAFDILPDGRFVGVVAPSDVVSPTIAPTQLRIVLNWQEELKARVSTK
jgi:Tol biopolymer transport system component